MATGTSNWKGRYLKDLRDPMHVTSSSSGLLTRGVEALPNKVQYYLIFLHQRVSKREQRSNYVDSTPKFPLSAFL